MMDGRIRFGQVATFLHKNQTLFFAETKPITVIAPHTVQDEGERWLSTDGTRIEASLIGHILLADVSSSQ